ncbi:MAG: CoA-binding protein, partial [Gemmatimonadota bacterium]
MTPAPPPWSRLFRPRSVAVVGASPKPGSYGLQAMRYLQCFPGSADVWPVTPSHAEVLGLRCYPEVAALPRAPDVAILLLGSERLPAAVEACAAVGVAFAILPGDLPRSRWAD